MKLTIITINYNSSENTIKLLESLKKQTDKNFDVIVVDNNSKDIDRLMEHRTTEDNVIYLKNDKNLGFSGGNNVGIKRALASGSDWVLLLNNDTLPEIHLIAHLKANLDPSAGSGQGGKEGIVGLVLDEGERTALAGKIEWLKPTLTHITTFNVVMTKYVDKLYVIGAAMAIKKEVFDRIGLLDENYFLYFEDADFCQRALKAGIPISFLPEIKISHSVSTSTKKLGSTMLLHYHYRNALYFNLKNGPWYIKLAVWPWSLIIVIKQLSKLAINRNKEESKAILVGVVDFYGNKMGRIVNIKTKTGS